MFLFLVIISLLVCSFLFYVEALKWGMNAKRWAVAAFLIGPFLLPMFGIAKHVHWRRAAGFNNLVIRA